MSPQAYLVTKHRKNFGRGVPRGEPPRAAEHCHRIRTETKGYMMSVTPEKLVGTKEAAATAGLKVSALRRLAKHGDVPRYCVDRLLLFHVSDILSFIESCKVGGTR
jgi:hypothetical protein